MLRHRIRLHLVLALLAVLAWIGQDIRAQSEGTPPSKTAARASTGDAGQSRTPQRRRFTQADREAAAARRATAATATTTHTTTRVPGRANSGAPPVLNPGGIPDYFNVGNYANSPLPVLDATGAVVPGTGIRKFIDTLPGLSAANANNLGAYIPVAVKNTAAFPGSDYYEIALSDYTQKMHTDLPATPLRGYRDVNGVGADAQNHYLGPLIIAKRGTPVRIKFTNALGIGAAGNLFIPVDKTMMGAGMGPDGVTQYTENRAVIHLHGGHTPWISDGTPHQWITPAGETSPFKTGASLFNVPDMPAPGAGSATYFWTNDQSSRLMFYHDHSYGITRLNVYAGEAAGYLIWDDAEEDLISGTNTTGVNPALKKVLPDLGGVYHYGVPLVIQDKTFLPSTTPPAAGQSFGASDPAWGAAPGGQLAVQDPTWDTTKWGNTAGALWFPHVYMPNQDPLDSSGANPFGRWDYGPWFWPPVTPAAGLVHGEIVGNGTNGCPVGKRCPGIQNPSLTPEAFMDTMVVNGTAYPYVAVQPRAYRLRILNASNDRALNLQFYYADPANPTEVKMVPAVSTAGFPSRWPTDDRDGGVPDPATIGPPIIQIGNESGFLPSPVVIESTPIGYEYDRRSITVLNASTHALALGPAERADVIVDFSSVPSGSTLILYNDAPAPWPAFDPRIDYYTGHSDKTSSGGAPPTLPGYGPNTRTIMQLRVSGTAAAPFDLAALQAVWPALYKYDQPDAIVPETANAGVAADTYSNIQDTSLSVNGVTYPLQSKAIQELFELNYGRMNATLGVELPLTNFNTQTTIPLGYVDPVTETVANGKIQLWKITHNGVDTHFVHFHLADVQVINRIGWDGSIRPPDPNEVGWKETVRMNPLEDIVVALKPTVANNLPSTWPLQANGSRLPDSTRPLDPTSAVGATISVTDPTTGNQVNVQNVTTNFGWEYVWHCHILGHEENDMMRPVVFDPTPPAAGPTITSVSPGVGPPAGGTTITIVGNNFPAAPQVYVGGVAATAVTVNAGLNQITATTPAGPAGLVADVVVTNPGVVQAPQMQGLTPTPNAGTVTASHAFAYVAPPTMTGITPAAGPLAGGTAATITGTNFVAGVSTVTIGGAAPISMAVTSPTTIDLVTPAGVAGAADVVVNTPGGGSATMTGGYTYMAAPTVGTIAPNTGPTTGGTTVTITGTNFVSGSTTVTIGGRAATSITVASATSLTAVTPIGNAGAADVVVTSPGGSGTLTGGYTYTGAPMITGIAPTAGPTAGGTTVTITAIGASFVAGSTTVSIGGNPATNVTVTSAQTLTCVTPAGAAGAASIVINTPTSPGVVLAGVTFTYVNAPTVTGVAPASGPTTGGTSVVLSGTNFVSGSTQITFGGTAAPFVNVTSATSLTVLTPPGVAGAAAIVVTVAGVSTTAPTPFTYLVSAGVSGITPSLGPTAGGTTVTITGTNFVAGSTSVTVGGNAATSITVSSPTSLTCVTPAGVAGNAPVVVTTPAGGASLLASGFTYVPVPTATTITPSFGSTLGGTTVTIAGTGFVPTATAVTIGGVAATNIAVNSATSISALTPPGTAGNAAVVVTTPGGSATATTPFTYYAVAGVSAIAPAGGPMAGGTAVTITGTNFVAGNTTVTIGGNAATSISVTSPTSLTCVTPAGAAGIAPVVVTTPAGGATLIASGFTYYNVPTATGIAPLSGTVMGNTRVTIAGTGFVTGATTLTIGGAPATNITVNSATSVSATTPRGTVGNVPVVVTTSGGTATVPGGFSYFSGQPVGASITSPAAGSTLQGTSVTVTWNAGNGVDAYWLDVGTSQGGYTMYSGYMGTALTTTVSGIPANGGPIWMRLWSFIGGVWVAGADVQFKAPTPTMADMLTPTPGTMFAASTVTFTWAPAIGMDNYYWLDVGTTLGGYDLYSKYQATTSATVMGLPTNGTRVYVRLWSHSATAGYVPRDYQYDSVRPQIAQLTSPAPGTVFTSSTVTFTWSTGRQVSTYWLDVGTSQGDYSIYSKSSNTTTATVTGIPINGQAVWVRLWSYIGGAWQAVDQKYTAAQPGPAQLITPALGSTLAPTTTFQWSAGAGVTSYWLDIGRTQGGYELYSQYQSTTSTTVVGLPLGGTVWVRLWSYVNGAYQWVDQSFTMPNATLGYITGPPPGSTLKAGSQTFTWVPGSASTRYWIDIGRSQGDYSLYSGHAGTGTSTSVSRIPAGAGVLWLRLWSFSNGAYQPVDFSFRTQ